MSELNYMEFVESKIARDNNGKLAVYATYRRKDGRLIHVALELEPDGESIVMTATRDNHWAPIALSVQDFNDSGSNSTISNALIYIH